MSEAPFTKAGYSRQIGEELVSALLVQPGLTKHLLHAREPQSPGVVTVTRPAAYEECGPSSHGFVLLRRLVFREGVHR